MKISRITIENFRNFAHLDIELAGNAVIVGENKIGKSNLLHALRTRSVAIAGGEKAREAANAYGSCKKGQDSKIPQ
jgi:AAA15 family ATPase/GTPase